MKGTARRGLTIDQDEEKAEILRSSVKNRAENLMILDMIRNDMGKVAEAGTVKVPALFEVETHPTVLQMTSTVECRTLAGFAEIVAALFPCASVTGAPKVRTMQIINQLESTPRGLYTGTMGYLLPDRRARFNVAIRTVELDRSTGSAEYGVGSGVVWDSNAEDEYRECLLKAEVLIADDPDFELLETMLWDPDQGYFLLNGHLRRLDRSAAYFRFPLQVNDLRRQLQCMEFAEPRMAHKVRILVSRNRGWRVESHPLAAGFRDESRVVGLARRPVVSTDVFLHHKTTHRRVYEEARKGQPYDDVILFNERGEITESTVANIVIKRESRFVTPPLKSGLLNGVFRQHLMNCGIIIEDLIFVNELSQKTEIYLINSVQKWMPVELEKIGSRGCPM